MPSSAGYKVESPTERLSGPFNSFFVTQLDGDTDDTGRDVSYSVFAICDSRTPPNPVWVFQSQAISEVLYQGYGIKWQLKIQVALLGKIVPWRITMRIKTRTRGAKRTLKISKTMKKRMKMITSLKEKII
jgi:hypothetical protein